MRRSVVFAALVAGLTGCAVVAETDRRHHHPGRHVQPHVNVVPHVRRPAPHVHFHHDRPRRSILPGRRLPHAAPFGRDKPHWGRPHRLPGQRHPGPWWRHGTP